MLAGLVSPFSPAPSPHETEWYLGFASARMAARRRSFGVVDDWSAGLQGSLLSSLDSLHLLGARSPDSVPCLQPLLNATRQRNHPPGQSPQLEDGRALCLDVVPAAESQILGRAVASTVPTREAARAIPSLPRTVGYSPQHLATTLRSVDVSPVLGVFAADGGELPARCHLHLAPAVVVRLGK